MTGSLSYRNQSIDLLRKSAAWFLYDRNFHHERVKYVSVVGALLDACLVRRYLWTQDINWTYIRRSEDIHDVCWTSYARPIYVLYPRGYKYFNKLLRREKYHFSLGSDKNEKLYIFWQDVSRLRLGVHYCNILCIIHRETNNILGNKNGFTIHYTMLETTLMARCSQYLLILSKSNSVWFESQIP